MNGIHEVTGSIPVWSTSFTSFSQRTQAVLSGAAAASRPPAASIPVSHTTTSLRSVRFIT